MSDDEVTRTEAKVAAAFGELCARTTDREARAIRDYVCAMLDDHSASLERRIKSNWPSDSGVRAAVAEMLREHERQLHYGSQTLDALQEECTRLRAELERTREVRIGYERECHELRAELAMCQDKLSIASARARRFAGASTTLRAVAQEHWAQSRASGGTPEEDAHRDAAQAIDDAADTIDAIAGTPPPTTTRAELAARPALDLDDVRLCAMGVDVLDRDAGIAAERVLAALDAKEKAQ
jgi:chromosome segregation ATPase